MRLAALSFLSLLCFTSSTSRSLAQVALQGQFVADQVCPAMQSIKNGTNPGTVEVQPGTSYLLRGKNNSDDATHFLIEVPGAKPLQRWVLMGCGHAVNDDDTSTDSDRQPSPAPSSSSAKASSGEPFNVLAVSWQAGFCETQPSKPECRTQTADRFDAQNFSLHGLWPQPGNRAYCGLEDDLVERDKAGNWDQLPPVPLSDDLSKNLAQAMPGVQSKLERHEWVKHGSCYPGADPAIYFSDSLRLLAALNASPVRTLFTSRAGRTLTIVDVRAAFDQTFGQGAGMRVRLACKPDGDRLVITEMTIGLRGDISSGTPLADLIQAALPTERGCPAGIVDLPGFQ